MFVLEAEAAWQRTAQISRCGTYRYALERFRRRDARRLLLFVMLNPSTADAFEDDNTITRCLGYADRWGYEWVAAVNLFAFRATDPRELREAPDPVGPDNDAWLIAYAASAETIVCAWGCHGCLDGRADRVLDLLAGHRHKMHVLARTSSGHPHHPLRLRADLDPIPFDAR